MNALQRFGDRDFAEGVPPPSAFTLTSGPAAEPCLAGSQPGMPCKIRSVRPANAVIVPFSSSKYSRAIFMPVASAAAARRPPSQQQHFNGWS